MTLDLTKPLPGPDTQQCYVLERWARERGWRTGAEIGVLRGRNLFHLLDTFPDLHMIGVDQWKVLEDTGEDGFETYARHDMELYRRYVTERAKLYGDRCRVIVGDSVEVSYGPDVPNESLDFVFIDACHTAMALTDDIVSWVRKLKPTGQLCGHDHHRPEVRVTLDILLPGWHEAESKCWHIDRSKITSLT